MTQKTQSVLTPAVEAMIGKTGDKISFQRKYIDIQERIADLEARRIIGTAPTVGRT